MEERIAFRIDAADLTPRNISLHACGLLSAFAALWSFLFAIPLAGTIEVARHGGGYRPATFVVERAVYQRASPRDEFIDLYWAEGTVEGRAERFSLSGSVAREPRSQEELDALVRPGQRFAVLYNPAVSDVMAQTRYLRVLPYEAGFERAQARRMAMVAAAAYGPLASTLVPLVVLRAGAERKHRLLALLWLGFAGLALGVHAVGAALFWSLPALR